MKSFINLSFSLLLCLVLFSSCSSGGNSDPDENIPETQWDEMNWDQGSWS